MLSLKDGSAVASWEKSWYNGILMYTCKEIITENTRKEFRLHPPIQGKIPSTELSGWEDSEDMKCHAAITGSILDLVGDRVHGWDTSSSPVTRLGVRRIGFGATIAVSWLPITVVLDTSGGVLRRGTPACESEKEKQKLHCSLSNTSQSNRRKLFLLSSS